MVSGNETRGRAHVSQSAHARSERPRVGFERARVNKDYLPPFFSATDSLVDIAILLSSLLHRHQSLSYFDRVISLHLCNLLTEQGIDTAQVPHQ